MDQKFSTARKGYDPVEVDHYIAELEKLIDQRNAELTEYKNKEAAINASLIQAQTLATQITAKAEQDAKQKQEDTEKEIASMRDNAQKQMLDITDKVGALREKLDQFKANYNTILDRYLVQARAQDMTSLFDDLDGFMVNLGMKKTEESPVNVTELNVTSEAAPEK